MNQRELNRSIAAATGETVSRIARLGFLLADPQDEIVDPNDEALGPRVIDYDACEQDWDEPEIPTELDLLLA